MVLSWLEIPRARGFGVLPSPTGERQMRRRLCGGIITVMVMIPCGRDRPEGYLENSEVSGNTILYLYPYRYRPCSVHQEFSLYQESRLLVLSPGYIEVKSL